MFAFVASIVLGMLSVSLGPAAWHAVFAASVIALANPGRRLPLGVAWSVILAAWLAFGDGYAPWWAIAACAGTSFVVAFASSRQLAALLWVSGAGISTVSMWVFSQVLTSTQIETWAPAAQFGLAAALGGAAFTLAFVPLHLRLRYDRLAQRFAAVSGSADLAEVAASAGTLWASINKDISTAKDDQLILDAFNDLAGDLEKWHGKNTPELVPVDEKIASVNERIESCGDETTKSQYLAARDALVENRKHVESLRRARDRAVAGMHRNLATLERMVAVKQRIDAGAELDELLGEIA